MMRRGLRPAGRKRDRLEAWFSGPEDPSALFAGRVLPFDERAGLIWARLMAEGTAKGRPRSALDTIIATIAEASGCIVVTDNEKGSTLSILFGNWRITFAWLDGDAIDVDLEDHH